MANFELKVELGNEAMNEPRDLAKALRTVAAELEDGEQFGGDIADDNGNTVGTYAFHYD